MRGRLGDSWPKSSAKIAQGRDRAIRYDRSVPTRSVPIAIPVAGVRAARWTSDELYRGIKGVHAIARVDRGSSEWWAGGRVWTSTPGTFQLKQPGDVHRELRRDGPSTFQIIALDESFVAAAVRGARVGALGCHQFAANDERAAAFARLHAAIDRGADSLALEVAAAEAAAAFAEQLTGTDSSGDWRRPVRRAVAFMREQLAEPLKLDAIAAHAGLDKFHLSRAFRTQVGLPPHAFLTQLRVSRAKELLAAGMAPSSVAPLVGFYDQSQLHRHFRRIVGTTPGAFRASPR